jgi:hypothetical protein
MEPEAVNAVFAGTKVRVADVAAVAKPIESTQATAMA